MLANEVVIHCPVWENNHKFFDNPSLFLKPRSYLAKFSTMKRVIYGLPLYYVSSESHQPNTCYNWFSKSWCNWSFRKYRLIWNIHNLAVKGAFALQELGNRCKFSVAVFKNKILVLKWCFRHDRFVYGIRCIRKIFR